MAAASVVRTILLVVLVIGLGPAACGSGGAEATGDKLSLVASRISGVAPLAVFFDATATRSGKTPRPFHDLEYRWDFGDPGSGTWATGSRPGVSSRNSATGPVSAHVFEVPGTYTIALTVVDGTNTASNSTVQVTVQDPDVVFAGAKTACFSTSGNFTGCPGGANQVTTSNFITVTTSATSANTVRRLLLRRGETWTAASSGTIAVNGPGIVGAFGSEALPLPVIQAVSPLKDSASDAGILRLSSATTPNISDWRVMDSKFDSGSGSNVLGVDAGGGINQVTLLRLASNDLRITVQLNSFLLDVWNSDLNPARHGHTIWDQIAVVDLDVASVHFGLSGDSNTWGYGTYVAAERLFYAGNSIDNSGTATPGVSHVARFPYLGKAVISNNTLQRSGPTEHVIKVHAPNQSATGVEKSGIGGGFSRWLVISDNKFVGGNNAFTIAVGPQDTSRDERVKDVIYERNWSVSGVGTQRHLMVWAQEVTVRNNIFDTTGALAHNSVTVTKRGLEPAPDQIRVYNNTVYSANADNDFVAVEVNATAKNVTVRNNLAYAPLDTSHLMINGTGDPTAPLIASNNSSALQVQLTNPNFASTSPFTPVNAKPTAGSYAINGGTSVPVWSDFFLSAQPATRTIGAVNP